MCGSGTLLIEAAQRAANIAPGLNRRFEVEDWAVSNPDIWKNERKAAEDKIDRFVEFRGYGFDIDNDAIRTARRNAKLAGVDEFVTFEYGDVSDFEAEPPSIVLCNPPYGERMLDLNEAAELYTVMGKSMVKKSGVSYYIINSQDDFEDHFGRKADRRRKLYNGNLPCQLYMYFK